ncbi:MAG: M42 family peptidase [Chloroflexi bacterium]|nr:MAG: M42 family peptidase [Chloroflexota bacterium]
MILEQLSNAPGVSSREGEVRKIILDAVKPHADEWHVDTMGNLFVTRRARKPANGTPLRVMVSAHMDEVGFIITKVTGEGLLKFGAIGGFDPRVLPGKQLLVGPDKIPGVIGIRPIHLLKRDQAGKVGEIKSMTIDVGATSKDNCPVKPGDVASFATQFHYLGSGRRRKARGRVAGKAFDDRAGCAILVELLQGDYPVDVIGVFTVQEEVGLRGARVAAYAANPDIAIMLECTAADDLPSLDENAEPGIPRLGDGPAITVLDRSFIADRGLVDLLIATAQAEGLPHQFKRPGIGGTDAGAVHLAREGVRSAVVSVPARFIHAPAAVLDLADFWAAEKLVRAALHRLPDLEKKL